MTLKGFESFATALTVGALCLMAMAGGLALLRLSLAEARGAPEGLRALIDDPIVGAAAALDLAAAETGAPPAVRARDLEALLRRAPLASGAWLDLAIARRADGEDISRVIEALRLSALTGPREARLMAARFAFALPFWAALPADLRERLIADLAGVEPYLEAPERGRLAALIEVQSDADIGQICAGLQAAAASPGCAAP